MENLYAPRDSSEEENDLNDETTDNYETTGYETEDNLFEDDAPEAAREDEPTADTFLEDDEDMGDGDTTERYAA